VRVTLGAIAFLLRRPGSPAHQLQETLDAMLDNRVVTVVRPHTVIPIPLSTRNARAAAAPLSMTPFAAELRASAALWAPLLSFRPLSPVLPAVRDIARFTVIIPRHVWPGAHAPNAVCMMGRC
jgi:hypothetical protein